MNLLKVVRKGDREYFYFRGPTDCHLPSVALGTDRADAERMAALYYRTGHVEPITDKAKKEAPLYRRRVEVLLLRLLPTLEGRAAYAKIGFDLDRVFLLDLIERQRWVCAVTKLPFGVRMRREWKWRWDPYQPSIDRIDAAGGYTKGNVRVVCLAVNVAIGEWGLETFLKIARAATETARERRHGNQKDNRLTTKIQPLIGLDNSASV